MWADMARTLHGHVYLGESFRQKINKKKTGVLLAFQSKQSKMTQSIEI